MLVLYKCSCPFHYYIRSSFFFRLSFFGFVLLAVVLLLPLFLKKGEKAQIDPPLRRLVVVLVVALLQINHRGHVILLFLFFSLIPSTGEK